MDLIFVDVRQNGYIYESFVIRKNCVRKYSKRKGPEVHEHGDIILKPTKKKVKLFMDGIFLYYFVQELRVAPSYRSSFMDTFYSKTNSSTNAIKLFLVPADKEILDYSWNDKIAYLVRERCELEHTLSWLSTLGGAFSALGDYFLNFAEIAGKISLNQLYLAFRLGDPNTVSRCRLYLSLSLIQQCRFKLARKIIYREYTEAINSTVVDIRLVNMCKGIWCKLKYEYQIYKKYKKKQ